ncbi:TPA: hypothetical protein PCH61_001494 [Klebsiella pneumoniae]|uniref:hypothetical protein n=1 Tax=Klebsiella pneumoniae complex TaxID=3390273 RepID=UPI000E31735E|nr:MULTISPECIES: hypothetical protein [Klebsiella]HBY0604570.1 hypothetical protein [Klebsiella pneumoniae subsp. pneumoniae]MBD7728835.1 hypothetical protein [Klebsiella pneumoniae]MCR1229601.1 hypothetical protein [Klebsiella quasipneumoniae]MED6038285.1 hypothetical protein [Klebsiella pneumoniae]RFD17775.1 hypothetical protein DYP59_01935 [Klebsiella pneumoniae]
MGIKGRGMNNIRRNMNALVKDITGRRLPRAMAAALHEAGLVAAIYTPVDTSTLINSQFKEVITNGTRITGRIGYSANYAIYVADPNIPQKFTLPRARKEFLQHGVADAKPQMAAAFQRELSKR